MATDCYAKIGVNQCHEDDAGRSHHWNAVQQWREQYQEELVDPIEGQKTIEEAIDQGKAVKSEQLSKLFLDRQPSTGHSRLGLTYGLSRQYRIQTL